MATTKFNNDAQNHEAAECFVYHRQSIVATQDSENWFSLYADWLRSIIILLLLAFGKLTRCQW